MATSGEPDPQTTLQATQHLQGEHLARLVTAKLGRAFVDDGVASSAAIAGEEQAFGNVSDPGGNFYLYVGGIYDLYPSAGDSCAWIVDDQAKVDPGECHSRAVPGGGHVYWRTASQEGVVQAQAYLCAKDGRILRAVADNGTMPNLLQNTTVDNTRSDPGVSAAELADLLESLPAVPRNTE